MSRSNTSSTTYTLVKYSRSYAQPAAGGEPSGAEWQHFVNPVIRLVLDVKKTGSGELESFRMRVLWSLSTDPESMDVDQREVVFEDLELLSFSNVPSLSAVPQGLPLKAVYRDSVIGIRYLHPRIIPAGAAPAYRRFQITFQSISMASGFIDMIRFVCPCKANPAPPPPRNQPKSAVSASQHIEYGPPASGFTSFSIPGRHNYDTTAGFLRPAASIVGDQSQREFTFSAASIRTPTQAVSRQSDSITYNTFITPAPTDILTASGSSSHPPPRELPSSDDNHPSRPSSAVTTSSAMVDYHSSDPAPAPSSCQITLEPPRPSAVLLSSIATATESPASSAPPTSSAPNSLPGTSMPPPPPPPSWEMVPPPSHPPSPSAVDKQVLLASLEETSSLYSLSRADLEQLVGRVVREDGFAKLLEDLDSMWRIKAFLGVR